jgi:hypothetical protein
MLMLTLPRGSSANERMKRALLFDMWRMVRRCQSTSAATAGDSQNAALRRAAEQLDTIISGLAMIQDGPWRQADGRMFQLWKTLYKNPDHSAAAWTVMKSYVVPRPEVQQRGTRRGDTGAAARLDQPRKRRRKRAAQKAGGTRGGIPGFFPRRGGLGGATSRMGGGPTSAIGKSKRKRKKKSGAAAAGTGPETVTLTEAEEEAAAGDPFVRASMMKQKRRRQSVRRVD